MVTKVNGVDEKLAAVSAELDLLPASSMLISIPAAGYLQLPRHRRHDRPSAHGYGIAIDIATRHADYWRWSRPARGRQLCLQEPDSDGDRAHLREARLHLGRQVVPLRHHALRVPARAPALGALSCSATAACGEGEQKLAAVRPKSCVKRPRRAAPCDAGAYLLYRGSCDGRLCPVRSRHWGIV